MFGVECEDMSKMWKHVIRICRNEITSRNTVTWMRTLWTIKGVPNTNRIFSQKKYKKIGLIIVRIGYAFKMPRFPKLPRNDSRTYFDREHSDARNSRDSRTCSRTSRVTDKIAVPRHFFRIAFQTQKTYFYVHLFIIRNQNI